jgi:hypothetical protein
MGLSKSFGSQAVNSVKLGKLHALPSTEDLLFVLATATQNKKMAELPCKNPHNNIDYTIKVVPATLQKAPRWTFERHTDQGTTVLWTRETNEVIMIQGKIKIDSNYSGAFYQEPAETDDQELDLDEAGAKGTEDGALSDAEAAGVEDEETTTEASDALSSERYDLDQDYETAKAAAVDDANRLDFQESHADEENAEIYNEQAGYEAGAGAEIEGIMTRPGTKPKTSPAKRTGAKERGTSPRIYIPQRKPKPVPKLTTRKIVSRGPSADKATATPERQMIRDSQLRHCHRR